MAAALNRAAFFDAVRLNPFPGALSASQVSGMEAILDACPTDTQLDHLAYCLGTCPIETAWTMLPIKEKGGTAYFARMYDIRGERPAKARELGNVNPGDGAVYCGRGYLQLTGRSNYRRATSRLRDLGMLPMMTDLEKTPDLAMDPDIAAAILFVGTREGWFTGRKLSNYFGAGKADWKGARAIINGQDRAAEIALHAQAFRAALVKAGYVPGQVVDAAPVTPVTVTPIPAPTGPLYVPAPRTSGVLPSPGALEPVKMESKPSAWSSLVSRLMSPWFG